MKKQFTILGLGACIIFALILLGSGCTQKEQERTASLNGDQVAEKEAEDVNTEKIYRTEKYGFSFTLPEKYDGRLVQRDEFTWNDIDYELLELEVKHPVLDEYLCTYGFAITSNVKHIPLNEWLKRVEGIDPDLVFINKKLENISAIKLTYQSDSETKKYPVLPGGAIVFEDPSHNWVIFPDFDQEHMILKYYDLGYDELENMILGSLKFE